MRVNQIFNINKFANGNEEVMDYKNSETEVLIIQRIKALRIEHNISQLALSHVLGVSDGQIGNIESPRFQHKYTLKQIYDFCKFIDYPFEKVFLTDDELDADNKIDLLIEKIIDYEG